MPPAAESQEREARSRVFRALSDPARLAIIEYLSERDDQALFELCTRLISQGMSLSRQAVSKHLSVLVATGLVETVRDGRTTRHRLRPAALADARAWLADMEES